MTKIVLWLFACVLFCACNSVLTEDYKHLGDGIFKGLDGNDVIMVDSTSFYISNNGKEVLDCVDSKIIETGTYVFVYRFKDGTKVSKTSLYDAAFLADKATVVGVTLGVMVAFILSAVLVLGAVMSRNHTKIGNIIMLCLVEVFAIAVFFTILAKNSNVQNEVKVAAVGELTDATRECKEINGTKYYFSGYERMISIGENYALFDINGRLYPRNWNSNNLVSAQATAEAAYLYAPASGRALRVLTVLVFVFLVLFVWGISSKGREKS